MHALVLLYNDVFITTLLFNYEVNNCVENQNINIAPFITPTKLPGFFTGASAWCKSCSWVHFHCYHSTALLNTPSIWLIQLCSVGKFPSLSMHIVVRTIAISSRASLRVALILSILFWSIHSCVSAVTLLGWHRWSITYHFLRRCCTWSIWKQVSPFRCHLVYFRILLREKVHNSGYHPPANCYVW